MDTNGKQFKRELKNVKYNMSRITNIIIHDLYKSFEELEQIKIVSFNSKKREMRTKIIRKIEDLNDKLQEQLIW